MRPLRLAVSLVATGFFAAAQNDIGPAHGRVRPHPDPLPPDEGANDAPFDMLRVRASVNSIRAH
jgi:hypothetical protein